MPRRDAADPRHRRLFHHRHHDTAADRVVARFVAHAAGLRRGAALHRGRRRVAAVLRVCVRRRLGGPGAGDAGSQNEAAPILRETPGGRPSGRGRRDSLSVARAYLSAIVMPLRSRLAIRPTWRPESRSTAPFGLRSTMTRAPPTTATPAPPAA